MTLTLNTMKSEVKFILLIMTALPMIYSTIVLTLVNQVSETAEATTIEINCTGFDYNDFDQRILKKFFDDEDDKDEYDGGRVFYSHSIMKYGTNDEEVEKEQIRNMFGDFGIVNKFYKGNHEKMTDEMQKLYKYNDGKRTEEMEFYKMIVGSCQMLVYSKWKDEITFGVAIEVNHAIDIGIPAFELVGDKFIPQKVHVQGLSLKETIEMNNDDWIL
jgi:hypothetical protein